jgi:putative ABC transport system permease protein
LPLIWAALRRKPAEAILTLLAITVGFTLFGLMIGLSGMYQATIDSARMDRLWVSPRFPDAPPNGLPFGVLEQIAAMDGVSAVGGIKGIGAGWRDSTNRYYFTGITEGMRETWEALALTAAQWDQLFATQNGAFISRTAARHMQLKEGDPLTLFTPPNAEAGARKTADLIVLGIVDKWPQHQEGQVLVNFRFMDVLRPPEEQGMLWEVRVAVRDPDRAFEIAQRIDRYFANSGAPTRSVPEKMAAQRRADAGLPIAAITWTVGIIGLFVVLLLVGNGISDSVQERTPELAVLSTLGFSNARIRALVFAEAFIPCLVGAIAGAASAPLIAAVPQRLLPPGVGGEPEPSLWIAAVAAAVVCALLIAIVGAAIPMLRLARLNVADALAGR